LVAGIDRLGFKLGGKSRTLLGFSRENKKMSRRTGIFVVAISLLFGINRSVAKTSGVIDEYLTAVSVFSQDDILKLNEGKMIANLLAVKDKREVAVYGVIPVKAPINISLNAFQETMSRQNKKSVVEFGSFSPIPVIDDINTLTLDENDIEDIKQCRIGNCKLKLSAAMIERFQREIDPNSNNYSIQVNQLFRQMILAYVNNYVLKGNSALIEYRDKREAVRLQDEYKSLLSGLLWINNFAPEFSKYLSDFKNSELRGVKKSIGWAKLKFGLKPVIIITETITYTPENLDNSQIVTVTKQIYASHYFDSSLGLTAFIALPTKDSGHNSYMFYTNHSRSSSLDGVFSKFKREIVEQEALRKLSPLLQDTKMLGETYFNRQNNKTEVSTDSEGISLILGENYLIWLIYLLGIIVVFIIGKAIKKIVYH
jgi:hypothetical protein